MRRAGFFVGGNGGALFNQNGKIAGVQLADGSVGGAGGSCCNLQTGPSSSGGGGGGGGGAAALAALEDDASLVGGAHAGFNWQNAQWVYGVEADIAAVEDTYEYVASLRGKLGWAYEKVLLYATAGVAFAKNDGFNGTVSVGGGIDGDNGEDGSNDGPASGGDGGTGGVATTRRNDDVETGFVIGTGTAVKLSNNVSLGMDGLYYFFDEGGNGAIIEPATDEPIGGLNDDNEFFVVRARLTLHFQN